MSSIWVVCMVHCILNQKFLKPTRAQPDNSALNRELCIPWSDTDYIYKTHSGLHHISKKTRLLKTVTLSKKRHAVLSECKFWSTKFPGMAPPHRKQTAKTIAHTGLSRPGHAIVSLVRMTLVRPYHTLIINRFYWRLTMSLTRLSPVRFSFWERKRSQRLRSTRVEPFSPAFRCRANNWNYLLTVLTEFCVAKNSKRTRKERKRFLQRSMIRYILKETYISCFSSENL